MTNTTTMGDALVAIVTVATATVTNYLRAHNRDDNERNSDVRW